MGALTHKFCAKCNTKKPITDFPSNPDSSDGKGSYCKVCKNNLGKERRQNDAKARFTHYIVTRLRHEHKGQAIPSDLETSLPKYLGYKLWQLRRKLRLELKTQGLTLTKAFDKGYHLDHKRPLSSFPTHLIGDSTFQECWAITNLELIPALENLQKGAQIAAEAPQPHV